MSISCRFCCFVASYIAHIPQTPTVGVGYTPSNPSRITPRVVALTRAEVQHILPWPTHLKIPVSAPAWLPKSSVANGSTHPLGIPALGIGWHISNIGLRQLSPNLEAIFLKHKRDIWSLNLVDYVWAGWHQVCCGTILVVLPYSFHDPLSAHAPIIFRAKI